MQEKGQLRERIRLWNTLLFSMLKIGCIGFGGGNALVPMIEKSVVGRGLLPEEVFEEDVVIANITPGALPVELAAGVGRRLFGRRGLLAAAMAVAAPGVIFTVLLLLLVNLVGSQILLQVQYLTIGITAAISCLLTDYVFDTLNHFSRRKYRHISLLIIFAVFALTCGKNVVTILDLEVSRAVCLSTVDVFALTFFLIFYTNCRFSPAKGLVCVAFCGMYLLHDALGMELLGGILGLIAPIGMILLSLYGLQQNFSREQKVQALPIAEICKDLALMLALLAAAVFLGLWFTEKGLLFVKNGALSSFMSFGGGDAYLTVADALFVHTRLVSSYEFYSLLVPIANILPGSILCKMLSGVGFLVGYEATGSIVGGLVGAAASFLVSVAASCGVFSVVGDVYRSFREVEVFQNLKKWVRPIVSGLMLTVISSLVYQNAKLGIELKAQYAPVILMGAIYAINQVLRKRLHIRTWQMFLLSAVLSLLLCNVAPFAR